MSKITVVAVGDARTPSRDELGRWEPGRWLGRDAKGEPRAEAVDDTPQVRRALARGDLAEAPAPLPPTVPADPPTVDEAPPGTEPAPPPGAEPAPPPHRGPEED